MRHEATCSAGPTQGTESGPQHSRYHAFSQWQREGIGQQWRPAARTRRRHWPRVDQRPSGCTRPQRAENGPISRARPGWI
jgi:hypothetical protein